MVSFASRSLPARSVSSRLQAAVLSLLRSGREFIYGRTLAKRLALSGARTATTGTPVWSGVAPLSGLQ